MLRPDSQAFASQLWTRRRGLEPPADPHAAAEALFACGRDACIARPGSPVRVSAWRRRIPPSQEALGRLCAGAEVVILRTGDRPAGACPGVLVLDQAALTRGGAAEAYRTPGGWRVVWAADLRGERPWTAPATAEEG